MGTIVRSIIGYFFLLLTVRVLVRRPGAQMTLFEFVFIFLIGGVIILSTVGGDRSVTNCTCAVITVALMHRSLSWIKVRSSFVQRLVDGSPLVLLKNGEWQEGTMRRMHMEPEDVMAAARSKGVRNLEQVQYAILERNGGISIIRAKQQES